MQFVGLIFVSLRGIGFRDILRWNIAVISKLAWNIAQKKLQPFGAMDELHISEGCQLGVLRISLECYIDMEKYM